MQNKGHEPMTTPVEAERGKVQMRERRGDARLILVMRGLRSLAYGFLAVILGIVLAGEGFSPAAIGILITVSLVGDMVGTYVIGLVADTWGRRRTLALLSLLMAGTGVIFGLVTNYVVLLVAAFFGTVGTSASEAAPFLRIDQAMIAQIALPDRRTALFARYNLVASLSAAGGALVAGLPALLIGIGLPLASDLRLLFGIYAVLGLVVACLSLPPVSSGGSAWASSHPVSEHQTASYPSTAPFARHRVKADCAPPHGCAGRRTGGAKPDGALLSSALWCATDNTLRPVLWGQFSLGALVPGSSAAGSSFVPTQHNGLHAPALECPLDPGSLRAHVSPGGNAAAVAPGAFADGCSHPAGLHDGPGRPGGANGRRQRDRPGSKPGPFLHTV